MRLPPRTRRRDRGCNRTSSSITVSGRRNFGICVRIMPPACGSSSNTTHVVAERQQIARDGRARRGRRRPARCACRSSARRGLGRRARMSSLLSAATRLRRQIATGSLLDAAAPAGRLAGPVAGAPENAGKHVRIPIDHVGVGVAARRDQADIFGHRRVRRAGPLAIDDLVEVVRDRNVGRFHSLLLHAALRRLTQGGIEHTAARIGAPHWLPCVRRFRARILVERGADFYRLGLL